MWQRPASPLLPDPVAHFLCCLAVALLPACHSDGPDAPFKRYLNQLYLALPGAMPAAAPGMTAPTPALGQWQVPLAPGDVEGLDASHLSGCAVQANIRKRQTSIGKFAKPSQRLIMALEFLHLAPACIRQLRADGVHALADRLAAARRDMQTQLPEQIFNATLGSDEYRAFWLATPAASGYPHSDTGVATSALEAVNRLTQHWLNGDYRVQNLEFELLLGAIAGGEGGQALARWSHQIDWLTEADRAIAQALATAASCSARQRDAPSLRRIALARSVFIDIIRPLTSAANANYQSLTAPVRTLEEQLSRALTPRYRRWATQRDQYSAALAGAPGQHLKALEVLLQVPGACELPAAFATH